MPPTDSVVAYSAGDTEAAGRRLGAAASAGDVFLLLGPLGAGKTVLVRGIAAGLGWFGEVGSPTFVLIRQYRGRLELVHADLYRLRERREVDDLGLLELSADGVLAVEWADRAPWLTTAGATTVTLAAAAEVGQRVITIHGGDRRLRDALVGPAS